MGKRGQLVVKALFIIVISALVILSFISAGKSYGSQEAYYKLAIARDTAITIDTLYGLPGDIIYYYPNDVSDYRIEISDNNVNVYQKNSGKFDALQTSHNFAGTSFDNLRAQINGNKFLKFEKIRNRIIITGANTNELSQV